MSGAPISPETAARLDALFGEAAGRVLEVLAADPDGPSLDYHRVLARAGMRVDDVADALDRLRHAGLVVLESGFRGQPLRAYRSYRLNRGGIALAAETLAQLAKGVRP